MNSEENRMPEQQMPQQTDKDRADTAKTQEIADEELGEVAGGKHGISDQAKTPMLI